RARTRHAGSCSTTSTASSTSSLRTPAATTGWSSSGARLPPVPWANLAVPGAVAQLGERVAGSHEVRGSSPLSSTSPPAAVHVGCHDFRNRFGYYLEQA